MIDRNAFHLPIYPGEETSWGCPRCKSGMLKVEAFGKEETAASLSARNQNDPSDDSERFVFWGALRCSDSRCNEVVSCVGNAELRPRVLAYDADEYPIGINSVYIFPLFFNPPLQLIDVPVATPTSVRDKIEDSFGLVFANPAAAANQLRVAVESILTSLKVKRFKISGGKRIRIPLHRRIDMLPSSQRHVRDRLVAIKWIGNSGSHDGDQLLVDDVLDAYEVLEEVLEDAFPSKQRRGAQLAKEINARKGPRKR